MTNRKMSNEIVDQIISDYRKNIGPFHGDGLRWPLEKELEKIEFDNSFQLANYLTLTGALNRRRRSSTLREKSRQLWNQEPWIYDPRQVVGENREQDLREIFIGEGSYVEESELGTDWNGTTLGETDFDAWWEISQLLYEKYDASSISMIATYQFDANHIWEEIAPDELPVLRGPKCGPLWLRQLDQFVHPMDNLWQLPLTLDTHIEFMTNEIYNTDYSIPEDDQAIRDLWADYCEDRDVTVAEVDDALWRIRETGNWNDKGKEYLNSLL